MMLNLTRSQLHIVSCIYKYYSNKLNFFVWLLMAISTIDSFDVLIIHWSQRWRVFCCFISFLTLQDEKGGASFIPGWARSHATCACYVDACI
jgi:hypothetical protein